MQEVCPICKGRGTYPLDADHSQHEFCKCEAGEAEQDRWDACQD